MKVGIKGLLANKLRSFLAMLGIIIGVAAVISMLALGGGAQKQVLDTFASMGSNTLIIMPGQRGSGGVMSGTQQSLTVEDAQAIANDCLGVEFVSPVISSQAQVKYSNKNTRTSIFGIATTRIFLWPSN